MKKLVFILVLFVFLVNCSFTQEDPINYEFGSTNYPGIQQGEMFLYVISTTTVIVPVPVTDKSGYTLFFFESRNDVSALSKNFNEIRFKSKRLGETAYTISGKVLSDHRPVFISLNEYYSK